MTPKSDAIGTVSNDGDTGSVVLSTKKVWAVGKEPKKCLRTKSFPLVKHKYGKTRVKVMKVVTSSPEHREQSEVYQYEVSTQLTCDVYEKVFTEGDNDELVATDTQKNTVYVVAKRTAADTPERFGLDLCAHFLQEYPLLQGVTVEISRVKWSRVHAHGFEQNSPETDCATVDVTRGVPPTVISSIQRMTILKTTNSGFWGYKQDQYTLLPECDERILATELDCTWTYAGTEPSQCGDADTDVVNYAAVRTKVRECIHKGFFGPSSTEGVYSNSLQATIYDVACLVLEDEETCQKVATVKIDTPNLHYIPFIALAKVTEGKETFEDDVFIPTKEPSGSITCTVGRTK